MHLENVVLEWAYFPKIFLAQIAALRSEYWFGMITSTVTEMRWFLKNVYQHYNILFRVLPSDKIEKKQKLLHQEH